MINHPVVTASELIVETQHPVAGRIRQTRPAARFSETQTELLRGAPLYGQHNEELLNEIGVTQAEQLVLRNEGVIT